MSDNLHALNTGKLFIVLFYYLIHVTMLLLHEEMKATKRDIAVLVGVMDDYAYKHKELDNVIEVPRITLGPGVVVVV